jgi:hypothetical protein
MIALNSFLFEAVNMRLNFLACSTKLAVSSANRSKNNAFLETMKEKSELIFIEVFLTK